MAIATVVSIDVGGTKGKLGDAVGKTMSGPVVTGMSQEVVNGMVVLLYFVDTVEGIEGNERWDLGPVELV